MPQRIQLSRTKGWRKPEGAIVVSRPSRWGNPFKIGEPIVEPGWWNRPACPYSGRLAVGTHATSSDIANQPYEYQIRAVHDRQDATKLFRAYAEYHHDDWDPEVIRRELGGHDLACWCPLPEPGEPDWCHAAVLLEISNSANPPPGPG